MHADKIRTGKALPNEDWALSIIFFVADQEVLADVATGDLWIKCIQADYVPPPERTGDAERRSRVPQRYFGWFKMRTSCFLELWLQLRVRELHNIAPQTIGGMHLTVWDGDYRV